MKPIVLIEVRGGMAHVIAGEQLVEVRDFDDREDDVPEFTEAEIAAADQRAEAVAARVKGEG